MDFAKRFIFMILAAAAAVGISLTVSLQVQPAPSAGQAVSVPAETGSRELFRALQQNVETRIRRFSEK